MHGKLSTPTPPMPVWPPDANRVLVALMAGMFVWQLTIFALNSPMRDGSGVISLDAIRAVLLDLTRPGVVESYGALSVAGLLAGYWWQPITNLFLNSGLAPVMFAVAILLIAGGPLERIVGRRHLVGIFLSGGLAGAIVRLAVEKDVHLLGSSASACAIAIAATTVLPEHDLRSLSCLRRMPVRLPAKYFAAALIFSLVLLFLVDNGPAVSARQLQAAFLAPLAGSFTGWFYARALGFGRRVPVFLHAQPVPALIAATAKTADHESTEPVSDPHEFIRDSIDPILEKISREGLDRLTPDERRLLEEASERLPDSSASKQ